MRGSLAKARHRMQEDTPEVNLTPLIDVVFLILIMFIVIAPLLELDRVELADSKGGKEHTVHQESAVSVHVFSDNTIKFNNQLVNVFQLEELLKGAKLKHPTTRPQLYHDKRALFGTYQSVKNALEGAGYHEVDVILKPA
jgi:biopolymer transport protein ExbD